MLKKILISICVILVILSIFQYTLIYKCNEYMDRYYIDLAYDLKSILQTEVIDGIDDYNETKDDKYIGGIIEGIKIANVKAYSYWQTTCDTFNYNKLESIFTEINKNLWEYSENNKTIDLNVLKEGAQYLKDQHYVTEIRTTEEFDQLVQQFSEIIYGE